MNEALLKKIASYSLLAVALLYVISGFGITQYGMTEKITFGLLTKSISFKIHGILIFIFIPLLAVHVYLRLRKR